MLMEKRLFLLNKFFAVSLAKKQSRSLYTLLRLLNNEERRIGQKNKHSHGEFELLFASLTCVVFLCTV